MRHLLRSAVHILAWAIMNSWINQSRGKKDVTAEVRPSSILLIRFARLGDILLLVPAIKALQRRFPDAGIDFLVGHRCAAVLEACRSIRNVISVNRVGMRDGNKTQAIRDIWRLARHIRRNSYDLVIDFHSFRETNLLTWFSRAPYRLGLKRRNGAYLPYCFNLGPVLEDKSKHVASVFLSVLEILGIQGDIENDLVLDLDAETLKGTDLLLRNRGLKNGDLIVGLNVGAGANDRIWPWENFAELAKRLFQRYNAQIILFSGPNEEAISNSIAEKVPEIHPILAKNLNLKELAGLVHRCKLLISNDTGPMHLGPATRVPTLGLFSKGFPEHYRPLGRHSRFLKCVPITDLKVDEVFHTANEMLCLICA